MVEPGPKHGTTTRYDSGCHCAKCRAANTRRQRLKRERRKQREGAGNLTAVPPLADSVSGTEPGTGSPKRRIGKTELAVTQDVASYDRTQPGFNTLYQSALLLAREMDHTDAAKAPLVKQLVTIVKMLLGEDGDDDGLDDLLDEVADTPVLSSSANRD